MALNKRRRSSDGTSSPNSSKYAALNHPEDSSSSPPSSSSMFISLPSPRMPSSNNGQMKRRSPLTPPSVTPASVTVMDHTPLQQESCRSPTTKARTLLEKVAVVGSQPPIPACLKYYSAQSPGLSSIDATPTATPPEDGCQFPFGSRKELPETPEGGYVSFPVFEAFGGYRSEEEDDPNYR